MSYCIVVDSEDSAEGGGDDHDLDRHKSFIVLNGDARPSPSKKNVLFARVLGWGRTVRC